MEEYLGTDTCQKSDAPGAFKHKKLGYCVFKDKYVTQVQVKPNVEAGDEVKFLVKGQVHASMKQQTYLIYVHFNQSTEQIVHANYTRKAGKGGSCKHVAALLFQIIDYIQLELKEIPEKV